MDTSFWTKAELYRQVDALHKKLYTLFEYCPSDAKLIAKASIDNLTIEVLPFPSNKICGILYKGNHSTSIALNANRSPQMQNFDCMHELIHFFFHDAPDQNWICFEGNEGKIKQDTYLEWQANEGAAQLLVPYQDFIPRFSQYLDCQSSFMYSIPEVLANFYNVTPQVINIRMSSLSYEIDQYRRGIAVENIVLLSRNRQRQLGIHPTPYGAVCDFSLAWDAVIG